MKRIDPLLRTQPWKITAVFDPIERVLHRLESDGTVEAQGAQIVFREECRGNWYDLPVALHGVIEFHKLAESRYNLPVDVAAMEKFANKLRLGSPIFEQDLADVRTCIASCKRQALQLRVSQAADIVKTVQISVELERLQRKAA